MSTTEEPAKVIADKPAAVEQPAAQSPNKPKENDKPASNRSRRDNRRGRGGMRGRGGRPPFMRFSPQKMVVSHNTFDSIMSEPFFPKAVDAADDSIFNQAIVKRNLELTPNTQEQAAVLNLVTKITAVIDNLIVDPDGFELGIEEVRAVGSHKKGTMLAGHPIADLAVILKKLPAATDIQDLASKIQTALVTPESKDDFPTKANEGGFNISSAEGALVRVLITSLPKNLREAEAAKHVDVKLLEGALATIRHARWFEENAFHTSVRVIVRIFKDMRRRFVGLQGLTPWLIDLLAHRAAVTKNSREPLPINAAFRRALQLLASGIFLPGSIGIIDPCESGNVRAHSVLSLEEQDSIASCSQTLLRCLSHGAYNEILGLSLEGIPPVALDTEITSWGGVIVTPGSKAYIREEQEKMAAEEAAAAAAAEGPAQGGEEGEKKAEEKMETAS